MEEIAFHGGYSRRWRATEPQGRPAVSGGGGGFGTFSKSAKMGQNWFTLIPTPPDRPSASDNKMGQNGKKRKANIPKIRAVHTSLSRPRTLWNPTETDDSAPDNTGRSRARAGDKSRRYRPPDLSSLDETSRHHSSFLSGGKVRQSRVPELPHLRF